MRDWIGEKKENLSENAAVSSKTPKRIVQLQDEIEKVIKGKKETVKLVVVALIAQGHVLIEDVPGIGKTTLANALSRALELSFQRIQFTSDLLPSDVVGLSIFNRQNNSFEWKAGPIFANIVLADELNRATPKTQSALLEAMAENQATVEGVSRQLPFPFMVIATQNPAEYHGVYPLPESQLDRFMFCLRIGYPNKNHEKQILRDRERSDPIESVKPLMTETDILEMQQTAKSVLVHENLVDYLLSIVEKTRENNAIELGISPRGTLSLFNSAQALAAVEGRDFCTPDDIKRLVIPCFEHRIIVGSKYKSASGDSKEAKQILQEILQKIKVPV